MGLIGLDGDLCVGLFYEHHFAVLKKHDGDDDDGGRMAAFQPVASQVP